jgi:hypothetical protein
MYFGIIIGVMGYSLKDNRPNAIDVFFGHRTADGLHLRSHKQVSRNAKDVKYNGGLYPIDLTQTNISMKHLTWENPVLIIDDTWASGIQGIQEKYLQMNQRDGITLKEKEINLDNMAKEIEDASNAEKGLPQKNGTNQQVRKAYIPLNINPIFRIAAIKLYNWFEDRMYHGTYEAVTGKPTKRNMYGFIILGVIMGAMGGYIFSIDYGLNTEYRTITTTV